MVLSASKVYRLTVDDLCQVRSEQGLDSSGPVWTLRQRPAKHVKSNQMKASRDEKMAQASARTDLVNNLVRMLSPWELMVRGSAAQTADG